MIYSTARWLVQLPRFHWLAPALSSEITRVIPHNQLLAFDTRRSDTTSLYRAISEDFHRLDGLEVDGSVVSGPRRLSSSLHPRAYAHISGTAEAIVQFCSRTRSSCILSLISHVLGTSLIPTNYLPRKNKSTEPYPCILLI